MLPGADWVLMGTKAPRFVLQFLRLLLLGSSSIPAPAELSLQQLITYFSLLSLVTEFLTQSPIPLRQFLKMRFSRSYSFKELLW